MRSLLDAAAACVAGLGVVLAVLVVVASRSAAAASSVLFDLFLASGLLWLSATGSWTSIALAAALLSLRVATSRSVTRTPDVPRVTFPTTGDR